MLLYEDLTKKIIGVAIDVHKELGPGLLESIYEECLAAELEDRKISFRRQLDLPVRYKGRVLDSAYRVDFLVEEKVIVELKSVEELLPIHEAQMLTYLKQGGWRLGLLINFNVRVLKKGIVRRIL